jgi:hypothetical protein
MLRVEESCTFAKLLRREEHVMPGMPVLFVVARGTPFYERFLTSFDVRV